MAVYRANKHSGYTQISNELINNTYSPNQLHQFNGMAVHNMQENQRNCEYQACKSIW